MKSRFQYLFFIAVMFSSCTNQKDSPDFGTYYGELPCADCSGISYQLTLNEDNTYQEKVLYKKAGAHLIIDEGEFALKNNAIHLTLLKGEGSGINDFEFKNDTLRMLDLQGNRIESSFSEKYLLTKTKPNNFSLDPIPSVSNLTFKANGNEPSWNLNIELYHAVKFTSMDENRFNISAPLSEPSKSERKDALSYHVQSESGRLNVSIFKEPCVDSMSGEAYEYKVIVLAQSDTSEVVQYEGCGRYPQEYKLNDVWALEEINGDPVKNTGEVPTLEIRVMEKRISGFSGCNRMTGSIDIHDGILHINNLGVTRMACPDPSMKLENHFLSLIRDTDMNFELKGLKLILTNVTSQDKLIFKKVD